MNTAAHTSDELGKIYSDRFDAAVPYRHEVWRTLTCDFFQRWVPVESTVLDLGCGYGEFINHVRCAKKYGMDLNAKAQRHLAQDVEFIFQDCSQPWQVSDASLDVIFTSNFFEHLPSKGSLAMTMKQAYRCLRDGGRLIAMGPNIKFVPGQYWDFWDHHLPLTELSLAEGLTIHSFQIAYVWLEKYFSGGDFRKA